MMFTVDLRKGRDVLLAVFILMASVFLVRSALLIQRTQASAAPRRTCLIIDPGHGGFDGGAIAANGVKESELNLSIALRLRSLADLVGLDTVMTRTDDSRRTDLLSYSEHEDLVHRAEIVNSVPNGVLISIHQNCYPTGQPSGAQVLYAAGEESRRFGQITHLSIINTLQPENRRLAVPAPKSLYLTANVTCPAILVECGFLSNQNEMELLCSREYQTSFAAVLLTSFLQFIPDKDYT